MAHTWWAVSTPQECRCWKPLRGGGERLWKSRSVETQRQGSHCAWKSRKGRGIPTFPQPRRRVLYVELESGHITCYKNRTSSRANNREIGIPVDFQPISGFVTIFRMWTPISGCCVFQSVHTNTSLLARRVDHCNLRFTHTRTVKFAGRLLTSNHFDKLCRPS